jgi:hypothetical protein
MPALRQSRVASDIIPGELMSNHDLHARAVEAIYASGAEGSLVSEALAATSRLLGGRGATLEVIDRRERRPFEVYAAGLPAIARAQHFEHFAAFNPRIPPALQQRPGEVSWDYKLLDEEAMMRDPFYSDFLPGVDFPDASALSAFSKSQPYENAYQSRHGPKWTVRECARSPERRHRSARSRRQARLCERGAAPSGGA